MPDFSSRNALVALIDEVGRLNGRLKVAFGEVRRTVGLGESEMTVLNAVVEADRPPTVAQIGRSLGVPRQLVQRAANALVDSGLIATTANPHHKRAPLLVPTDEGEALKRRADAIADRIAARLSDGLALDHVAQASASLNAVRKALEARLREEGF